MAAVFGHICLCNHEQTSSDMTPEWLSCLPVANSLAQRTVAWGTRAVDRLLDRNAGLSTGCCFHSMLCFLGN